MENQKVKFFLKSIVSIALMVLLVYKIKIPEITEAFNSISIGLFLFAWVLFLIQQGCVAYCWQILLNAQNSKLSFVRVLNVHFIGTFFGVFMPSSVGMDFVRAYLLSRHMERGIDSMTSLFVSRVVGYLLFFVLYFLIFTHFNLLLNYES